MLFNCIKGLSNSHGYISVAKSVDPYFIEWCWLLIIIIIISFMYTGPAGKITVIKAGPGYMEEKHYDIGTDGNLVEITEQPPALLNDGCE